VAQPAMVNIKAETRMALRNEPFRCGTQLVNIN
jgi:hypothetical protein